MMTEQTTTTKDPEVTPLTLSLQESLQIAKDMGIIPDNKRFQLLQAIFDPESPEKLTVLTKTYQITHLNYMRGLIELLGKPWSEFLEVLYLNEIALSMSYKGVSLDKFTDILENQAQAQEITVHNKSIADQVTEPKQGFFGKLFNRGGSDE